MNFIATPHGLTPTVRVVPGVPDPTGAQIARTNESMSAFEEVRSDPDVCSNCFRRTHDRYERNYRLEVVQKEDEDGKLRWTVEPVEVTQEVKRVFDPVQQEVVEELEAAIETDVYKLPENVIRIPERGGHRGFVTACECGFRYSPESDWKNRPLDKSTFFDYAENLLARLRESGASIDEDTYFEELDARKSDPDNQFADDRIFREAIEQASAVESVG